MKTADFDTDFDEDRAFQNQKSANFLEAKTHHIYPCYQVRSFKRKTNEKQIHKTKHYYDVLYSSF